MCSKSRFWQLWKKPHLQHFNQLKSCCHASLPAKVEFRMGHTPLGLVISLASAGQKLKEDSSPKPEAQLTSQPSLTTVTLQKLSRATGHCCTPARWPAETQQLLRLPGSPTQQAEPSKASRGRGKQSCAGHGQYQCSQKTCFDPGRGSFFSLPSFL